MNFHWSPTSLFIHPEPLTDPPGVYLYLPVAGNRPAFFPPIFSAPSLLIFTFIFFRPRISRLILHPKDLVIENTFLEGTVSTISNNYRS